MNTQQRNKQESNLNGKTVIWIEKLNNETLGVQGGTTDGFLTVQDLSDRELNELNAQVILCGMIEGSISTEDRNCTVNWEKR